MPSKPTILKTDAFVLRAMNYGETSRIVTLYTQELGKISALAKGARSSKSRFGSTLEPLAHIQVILYVKPSRSLQSVTEASHVNTFPKIREDLQRIEVGLRILELVNSVFHDTEKNVDAFRLLVQVITSLGLADARVENLWPYFQIHLAAIFGFAPAFMKHGVENVLDDEGIINLQTGEINPGSTSHSDEMAASRSALRAFAVLARAPVEKILQMSLRPEVELEVRDLVEAYLRVHFGELYPGRSSRVFAQFEKG